MSYRSHVAAPSRVFDHLYDPTFTTSDSKNIYKENCLALTRSAPIRVYPVYSSMFSELSYEERNCYAYQKNALPFITPKDSLKKEKKFPSITGANRPKFFSNPLNNIRTINVGLMADKNIEKEDENKSCSSNKAMQTLYRESSAQTKSWFPECYTNEVNSDVPELVYAANIIETTSYPGIKEIEIIERARKRRAWETTLPPIKTVDEIPTRVAALEAFEWEEWIAREKDINECQQARLQIVAKLIEKREERHKSINDLKIENTKKRSLIERNRQKSTLINNFQRCMRKIDLAKRKESFKDVKDDPIFVHYDRKMDYTIPKLNVSAAKNKRTLIEFSNEFKDRFASLEQQIITPKKIQNYLKPKKQELWIPKEPIKEIERGIWNENYLKRLHESLRHHRRKTIPTRKPLEKCSLIKTESPLTVLPFQALDDHIDKYYQDNTLVQKTIKGRAIQSMLQKGMKKFQDVIQEAKETQSIAAVRKLFPKDFSQQIDCQEVIVGDCNRLEEILINDNFLQEDLKNIESKDARNLLRYLGEELKRLHNEKQSQALYLLAERERYRREAEKFGESCCEEQFKNDSVTLYLENILLEGINRTYDDYSRSMIRELAQKIDCKASKEGEFSENKIEIYSTLIDTGIEIDKEKNLEHLNLDTKVLTELLIDNMIPQVMYNLRKEKLITQQREYLMIAHQDLYKEEIKLMIFKEERNFCKTLVNEMIENAITLNNDKLFKKTAVNEKRQMSLEAEILASQIVEDVLNGIISSDVELFNELQDKVSQNSDCRDFGNQKEILFFQTETESSDDLLADIVTHDVLSEVVESETSSASEISEKYPE